MTPKNIDIHILCARCGKTVDHREMLHDPGAGKFRYFVSCHGEKDFGPHLEIPHTTETATLTAFPEKAP